MNAIFCSRKVNNIQPTDHPSPREDNQNWLHWCYKMNNRQGLVKLFLHFSLMPCPKGFHCQYLLKYRHHFSIGCHLSVYLGPVLNRLYQIFSCWHNICVFHTINIYTYIGITFFYNTGTDPDNCQKVERDLPMYNEFKTFWFIYF